MSAMMLATFLEKLFPDVLQNEWTDREKGISLNYKWE